MNGIVKAILLITPPLSCPNYNSLLRSRNMHFYGLLVSGQSEAKYEKFLLSNINFDIDLNTVIFAPGAYRIKCVEGF